MNVILLGVSVLLISKAAHADGAEIMAAGIFGVVGTIYLVIFGLLFKLLRFVYNKLFK
jgi:hypothetical protein